MTQDFVSLTFADTSQRDHLSSKNTKETASNQIIMKQAVGAN